VADPLLFAFCSSQHILNEHDTDRFIESIHAFRLREPLGDLTPFLLLNYKDLPPLSLSVFIKKSNLCGKD
jgi:hypothetical protein